MKFRQAKKLIKAMTNITIKKGYTPNDGYVVTCNHGVSELTGLVGSRRLPTLRIDCIEDMGDGQFFSVDMSF